MYPSIFPYALRERLWGGVLSPAAYVFVPAVTWRDRGCLLPVGQRAAGAGRGARWAGPSTVYLPLVMAPNHPVAGASSFDLIDQAEADGTLDSETALIYKVYVAFDDPRLPAQYRGDNTNTATTHILDDVTKTWDALSDTAKATLTPFFIPPVYANSWYAQRAGPSSAVQPRNNVVVCGSKSATWAYMDSVHAGVNARVWYQPAFSGDAATAAAIRDALDATIWPKLTALMQRTPLSDGNQDCNGFGDRLDFYLVPLGASGGDKGITTNYIRYIPPGCKQNAVYIELNRDLPLSELLGSAAHELMHALQWTYDVNTLCLQDEYTWLMEATATWAMDFVYPNTTINNLEHTYAPWFLDQGITPLEYANRHHEYGDYLFFFYLTHKYSNDVIRKIWEATESRASLAAVDAAIAGGFDKRWPEFSLYTWNQAPVDDYAKWDKLTWRPTQEITKKSVTVTGAQGYRDEMNATLKHLTTHYYDYTFGDDAARTVTFFNGLGFNLSQVTVPDGKASFTTLAWKNVSQDVKKGLKIQALYKLNGAWQPVEDWTGRPYVSFCRNLPNQKLEELVLIVSNSEWQDANYELKPQGLPPTLTASNIYCGSWQGTASSQAPSFQTGYIPYTSQATNVELTPVRADIGGLVVRQTSAGASYLAGTQFIVSGGTVTDKVDYTAGPCHYSGSKSAPASQYSTVMLVNNFSLGGSAHRRYTGYDITQYDVTLTCPHSSTTTTQTSFWFSVTAEGSPVVDGQTIREVQQVADDGQKMAATKTSSYGVQYTWNFSPKP